MVPSPSASIRMKSIRIIMPGPIPPGPLPPWPIMPGPKSSTPTPLAPPIRPVTPAHHAAVVREVILIAIVFEAAALGLDALQLALQLLLQGLRLLRRHRTTGSH